MSIHTTSQKAAALYPGFEHDIGTCQAVLKKGSKSFTQASWLLPRPTRDAAAAVYAFCRIADDLIDEDDETGIADLRHMIARIYTRGGQRDAIERALGAVVFHYHIPISIFNALVEGFAWDRQHRQYASIEDLEHYCARVASTVGVIMTLIMGIRDPWVLGRAAELGLAMQLTNIARDVGEDARHGRVYLPLEWLGEQNVSADELVVSPMFSSGIANVVKRILAHAEQYYLSASHGLSHLPRNCQSAMWAARLIYADIGTVIRENRYDSINHRAHTSTVRKLWLMLRALFSPLRPPVALDRHMPEAVRFLAHGL
ncbi:MAG: phytoene/squalene synthase family protein [Myxococcales bacterium]|nr:phytoene/squalene synthase family protein [Myxococcales bacterium]MCB9707451.1 phytoene/squalene synthase family protein [Myxococcales bacterium]